MSGDEGVRVDLYRRDGVSPAVREQQRRVQSRLKGALEAGELGVHEHPKRVPASGANPVFERFDDVRDWATEADVSLAPFFAVGRSYDPESGRVREMITLPVLWLTLSQGGSLRASPHVDGEVETVSDAVGELLADDAEVDPAD
jgi:hypothetical protein